MKCRLLLDTESEILFPNKRHDRTGPTLCYIALRIIQIFQARFATEYDQINPFFPLIQHVFMTPPCPQRSMVVVAPWIWLHDTWNQPDMENWDNRDNNCAKNLYLFSILMQGLITQPHR